MWHFDGATAHRPASTGALLPFSRGLPPRRCARAGDPVPCDQSTDHDLQHKSAVLLPVLATSMQARCVPCSFAFTPHFPNGRVRCGLVDHHEAGQVGGLPVPGQRGVRQWWALGDEPVSRSWQHGLDPPALTTRTAPFNLACLYQPTGHTHLVPTVSFGSKGQGTVMAIACLSCMLPSAPDTH